MARTESSMLALGTKAPAFALPDITTGATLSGEAFAGKPLLVIFLCNHCPYVIHVKEELARIGRDFASRGLALIAITSNDVEEYPQDSPEATRPLAAELGFPILYDATQEVAKAFTATCTPDFFLFDKEHALAYRGRLDETRPRQEPPHGGELRAAIEALLRGENPSADQHPSIGCNIKWK